MGIKERKKREKIRRRNDIIDAAEKVFFSKGLEQATMDDVAETAELSKGTLYLYFKSKEELYLAINLRGHKILESMFKAAVKQAKTGLDKVTAIGRAYMDYYIKHPNYFNFHIYYESHAIQPDEKNSIASACQAAGEQVLTVVANAIQLGIDDGTIRNELDPFKTALCLWSFTYGLIQNVAVKGKHIEEMHQVNPEDLVDHAFEMMTRSLLS